MAVARAANDAKAPKILFGMQFACKDQFSHCTQDQFCLLHSVHTSVTAHSAAALHWVTLTA